MVLIDTTNENVFQHFKDVLAPAQYAEFEASTLDQSEPGSSLIVAVNPLMLKHRKLPRARQEPQ